jgi:hypothetical protein
MPDKKPDETTRPGQTDDTESRETTENGGTQTAAERDAADGEGTDYKALHLANKQTIEDLKRERDEAIAKAASGSQPVAETRMQSDIDAREVRMMELRRLAPVDAVAAEALAQSEDIQQMRQDTMDALALTRLPEDKQGPMAEFYEKNRRHFRSMAECIRYVKGREAESKVSVLEKRIVELEKVGVGSKGEEEERPVRTSGRDVSRNTLKAQTITREAFHQKQAELKEAGRFDEARSEQRKLRDGRLVLKG